MTAGAEKISSFDGESEWLSDPLGKDGAAFVKFWSAPENRYIFQNAYPYVLDLRIHPRLKNIFDPLPNIANKIVVIEAYDNLYNRIQLGLKLPSPKRKNVDNIRRLTRPVLTQKGVLITGQPGTGMLPASKSTVAHYQTGKSMSLVYIAIRLLQDYPLEPLLFIQFEIALLFYQGKVYKLEGGPLQHKLQLPIDIFSLRDESPSCIALVEWNKQSEPPQHLLWGYLVPIFASSPNFTRTRQFIDQNNPFIWSIPTWSLSELRVGRVLHVLRDAP